MASAAATHFQGPDGYYYAIMDFNYYNGHWSPKSDSRVQRYTKSGDKYFEIGPVEWVDVSTEPAATSSYTVPAGGGGGGSPYFNGHNGYYYAKNEFNMTQRPPRPRYRHPPKKYMKMTMYNGSDVYEQVVDHYTTPAPSSRQVADPMDFTDRLKRLIMSISMVGSGGGNKLSDLKDFEGSEVWFGYPAPSGILNFYFVQYDNSRELQGYIILQKKDEKWKKYFIRDDPEIKWGFVDPKGLHFKVNQPYTINGVKQLYYQGVAYEEPQTNNVLTPVKFSDKRIFTDDEFNNNFFRIFFNESSGEEVKFTQDEPIKSSPTAPERRPVNENAELAEAMRRSLENQEAARRRAAEEEAARRRAAEEEAARAAAAAAKKKANNNAAAAEAVRRQLEVELAAETRRKREARQKLLKEMEAARLAAEREAARSAEISRIRANVAGRLKNQNRIRALNKNATLRRTQRRQGLNAIAAAAAQQRAYNEAADAAAEEETARAAEIAAIRANVVGRLANQNRNRALTVNATLRRTQRNRGLAAIAAAAAQQRAYNEAAAQPLNSTVSSLLSPGHRGLLNRFTERPAYPSVIGSHSTMSNLMMKRAVANAKTFKEAARESGNSVESVMSPAAAGTGIRVPPPRALVNAANGLFANPLLSASAPAPSRIAFDPTRVAALSGYSRIGAKPATTTIKNNNSGAKSATATTTRKNKNEQVRFGFNPMHARGKKANSKGK